MYIIGIAGGSGSGKTTFSEKVNKLVNHPQVSMLSMDSYYLPSPPENIYTKKGKANFDHPDAFDWSLLENHLQALKEGKKIYAPVYDFTENKRLSDQTIEIGPCKILLFEGIFTLFKPKIREILDIKCFLHVEADIRFTRRLHRDTHDRGRSVSSVIDQYYDTVRPMYQKYLDPQKQFADFIVGEETDNASKILSSRVKEIINETDLPKVNLEKNLEQEALIHEIH